MASNARFHNKYHRRNHHTLPSAGYPDSGADPIASPQEPFLGDFHAVGALSATGNLTIGGNTLVYGNLSALGNFSFIDTFVTVTSALSVINDGTGPAFTVQQKGAQPIAIFFDDNTKIFNLKDGLRAEFFNSQATNTYALAEGQATLAQGNASHSEGISTQAFGQGSHAEGAASTATGDYSHAEGDDSQAIGNASHSEGDSTVASGEDAHAEGNNTVASGLASHAEGIGTLASNTSTHAEGFSTSATGLYSHAEGYNNFASGTGSHAEGTNNTASGTGSHAEGYNNFASGNYSHAEGYNNFASGSYSHAEGTNNTASGTRSHAEGGFNWVSGSRSHAEGSFTRASGNYSHTEGQSVSATSDASHAEGFQTTAAGSYSHAQGNNTIASGIASHAAGAYSNAIQENTTAIGVKANAAHRGAVVISTNTNQYNSSSFGDETFNVFASGGTYIFNKTTIGDPVSATSFVVTSGGLVGINVNSPSERLTVNGNISSNGTLFTTSVTSRGIDIFHTPANDGINPILRIGEYSTSSGNLGFSGIFMSYNESTNVFGMSAEFDPAMAIPAIAIDRNSNVGIGTNAPDQKLHVLKASAGTVTADTNSIAVFEGGSNAHISVITPNAQTGGVVFGSPSDNFGSYLSWNYDNNALKLATAKTNGFIQLLTNNEAEAVRITSSGNVGIGTTLPEEKLTVVGTISTNAHRTSQDWWSNWTTTNTNSAAWGTGGGGGIPLGTVQTYLSTNNVLLSGTTVTGNISSNGTFATTAITARSIDLLHIPANDGTNPILRMGEYDGTSTNGYSGFHIEYIENTNSLTLSSIYGATTSNVAAVSSNGDINFNGYVYSKGNATGSNVTAVVAASSMNYLGTLNANYPIFVVPANRRFVLEEATWTMDTVAGGQTGDNMPSLQIFRNTAAASVTNQCSNSITLPNAIVLAANTWTRSSNNASVTPRAIAVGGDTIYSRIITQAYSPVLGTPYTVLSGTCLIRGYYII